MLCSIYKKWLLLISPSLKRRGTYASLILIDAGVAISNDKIAQLLAAANVKISDNFGGLFAKASADLDLKGLVSTISTSIGSGAPAAQAEAAPAAKEESEEESDDDMGFG